MFTEALNQVALERAAFVRDVEYIRSNVEDAYMHDYLNECYEKANGKINIGENTLDKTDSIDPRDIEVAISKIPVEDLSADEEIHRISTSDKDIDIDTMLGLADDIEHLDECDD